MSTELKPSPGVVKFPLGQMVATPGALDALAAAGVQPSELLARHLQGDWGQLSENDAQLNDEALAIGGRLLSAYMVGEGEARTKVWVITEADRSATTILLPSEY